MQFLAETAKTKLVHDNYKPKLWFFNETEHTTIPNWVLRL